ncbi:hypothetical protein ACFSM5_19205 [Lacibacterium aquatile]|uniref:Glycine zipper domain-containing protein n=1 Tax=Lacibacterium aquatile TaxID=1168082 RepID=A0ABW5E044_9PROT
MGLKLFRSKTTALVVVAAMGLAACQTTDQSSRPLTPAEQQLRAEADTFNETVAGGVVTGVVVGALLGALVGAASGGKNRGQAIATGAAVGAAAGGVLGGVDGYMTAKAQENANNKVRMLNSMTEDAKKDTDRLRRMVASSNTILADSKDRLEDIKADVAAKRLTVAQANAERSRIEANQALMQKTLETGVEKRNSYKEAAQRMKAQGGNTAEMDAQIAAMEKQVQELEANVSSLNSALEVTRVG